MTEAQGECPAPRPKRRRLIKPAQDSSQESPFSNRRKGRRKGGADSDGSDEEGDKISSPDEDGPTEAGNDLIAALRNSRNLLQQLLRLFSMPAASRGISAGGTGSAMQAESALSAEADDGVTKRGLRPMPRVELGRCYFNWWRENSETRGGADVDSPVSPMSSDPALARPAIGDEGGSAANTNSSSSSELRLKQYQVAGVKWLQLLHRNNQNGILADEMGLVSQ
eukprot:GHVU01036757.1.p1 GENE.GHVU01036757.1~~GHVU01036757.1.p1  ORF type:complete len:224 (-),score=35.52 GHVU01036757.1:298-969(-)